MIASAPSAGGGRRAPCLLLAMVFVALGCLSAAALPPKGAAAPGVRLPDLDGSIVNTADLAPRVLVLLFGELGHEGVKQAAADTLDVLADPRIDRDGVIPLMIVAQDAEPAALKDEAARGRYPALILHDRKREAFGPYRILVVPSVVVIDGHGKVVHALPGFVPRFKELLSLAVRVAAEQEPSSKLDAALDPSGGAPASPNAVRAARLTHLGAELARHGLLDLAASRYGDALALMPESVDAKLGLGSLMLRMERAEEAEALFRSVLAGDPDSIDARLGTAEARLGKGPEGAKEAEAKVRGVIEKSPGNARAHYLMGRIREATGAVSEAMADYRRAAEILLSR
ncbi:MAG: tetratricopeptide repeat protein [Phycisphaerae bacterium]|nr:tetratricopeptide repeat protein [Phycisphaerae bacterium]